MKNININVIIQNIHCDIRIIIFKIQLADEAEQKKKKLEQSFVLEILGVF